MLTHLRQRPEWKPSELAGVMGVSMFTFRKRLADLEARGLVVATGNTFSRRISLKSGRPTKEVP